MGQIESVVERDGKVSQETRYFITSARERADAGTLLRWARGHWSIENRSHYVRDVTLGEDASRIRKGGGPEIMAAAQCGDRLLPGHRRDEYRRDHPSERFSGPHTPHQTGHLQKVKSPDTGSDRIFAPCRSPSSDLFDRILSIKPIGPADRRWGGPTARAPTDMLPLIL